MNQPLKTIQKNSGIKMGKYDNNKNRLFNYSKTLIYSLKMFIKEVEEFDMTNEQFFLDFLDQLNEISVKY